MSNAKPLSLESAFCNLVFEPARTPESQNLEAAFCELSPYRNGAIYLGHWAGQSEWEIHREGDEIVMVIEGETNLTLLADGKEITHHLESGYLLVVPQGTWHQFSTPKSVKVMTVTPQPTDHSIERPVS